jgi:large subunit ribosomal protein L25
MSEDRLDLKKRSVKGKKVTKLRLDGWVPGVIYGGKLKEPVLTESEYGATERVLLSAGYHSPVNLTVDGKGQLAMVKNIDLDPVRRKILNVEFMAISSDDVVSASAPIELIGLGGSEAEKANLSILQVLDEIEVRAKPADLPAALEISVEGLATTDDRITLADIKLPSGVEFADKEIDLNQVIANVYDPAIAAAKAEEEAAAEAAAAAEASAEVPAEHGEGAASTDSETNEEKKED